MFPDYMFSQLVFPIVLLTAKGALIIPDYNKYNKYLPLFIVSLPVIDFIAFGVEPHPTHFA